MRGFVQSVAIFVIGMLMIFTLLIYSLFSIYISSRVQIKGEEVLKEIDKAENIKLCMVHAIYYSYINALERLGYENMNSAISTNPSTVEYIRDESSKWLQDVIKRIEQYFDYRINLIELNITVLDNSPYFVISSTYSLERTQYGDKLSYKISHLIKVREYIDIEDNSLLYYEYVHPN